MPSGHRVVTAALLAWFLILFAHSATAIGFDSTWYGLRGERVLVGAGSAFAAQGLVMPVYYFPKIYELFLIPVSALGSSSVIAGISICSLGLLAAACHELLRQLGMRDLPVRIASVGLVATLPAIANYALEMKPDVLSAFLIAFAWLHAADFLRTRSPPALLWLLALLALAVQAKLTAIPFAATLAVATSVASLFSRPANNVRRPKNELRVAQAVLAMTVIVGAFATARTLLLAGVPTVAPEPLLRLWHALGFELAFPVSVVRWQYPKDWSDSPALAIDLLFRPQLLGRIVITWTGNVWFWLGSVVLVSGMFLPRQMIGKTATAMTSGPGIALMLTAFALMLCWGYDVRGGDGNYFISGIAPAILMGAGAAWRRLPAWPPMQSTFVAALGIFVLFQAGYCFLSAAWSPGTRGFDLDFARSTRALIHRDKKDYAEQGVARIVARLRNTNRTVRLVGCTPPDDGLGFRMPASYEGFGQIMMAKHEVTDTVDHFLAFLKADRIEFLIVPAPSNGKSDCRNLAVLAQTVAELDNDPRVSALRDQGYILYDLSGLH